MVESTYNAGKVFNLETMSSTEIPNIEVHMILLISIE